MQNATISGSRPEAWFLSITPYPCSARTSLTIETVPPTLANPEPLSRKAPSPGANSDSSDSTRQLQAPALLRLWHLASLDAPTVAVIWALAFAWAAKIRLPLWIPVLLALVAWAVYVGDRLLDAQAAQGASQPHRLRERHHFHWRHRSILIPMAIGAACIAACIVFFLMPAGARERNSLLATAAFAYLTCVHSSRRASPFLIPLLPKELLVGLLFTAACALPALSRAAAQPGSSLWILIGPVLFFAALAWLNCHAIERWESRGPSSSNLQVLPAACLLTLTGLLFAILMAPNHFRLAALVAAGAASALLLALLDRCRHRLTPIALRAAADLVLLTPLILLLQ
jgi:hypothetical protein